MGLAPLSEWGEDLKLSAPHHMMVEKASGPQMGRGPAPELDKNASSILKVRIIVNINIGDPCTYLGIF